VCREYQELLPQTVRRGEVKMKAFATALALIVAMAFSAPAFAGAGKEAFVGCQIAGCPATATKKSAEMKMTRAERRAERKAHRHGASNG
jgi:hypothetical protein